MYNYSLPLFSKTLIFSFLWSCWCRFQY